MAKVICQGDLVESKAGRDLGKIFLVITVEGNFAYLVDGRCRKVSNPKKKNVKHLKKVSTVRLNGLAEEIQGGSPVGNERVYRMVRAEKQKIQED